MSVEFEDEYIQKPLRSPSTLRVTTVPWIVTWLLKIGIIRSEKQAQKVLLITSFLCIIISTYLLYQIAAPPAQPSPTELQFQLETLQQGPRKR
jgi:hypothetical protein